MKGTSLGIAAVQLSSQSDLATNLEECHARVQEAAALGASIVVLPENFAYMGPEEGKRRIAEPLEELDGPIGRSLSDMALRSGVVVVAGGLPERSADPMRPYNTCAVFGRGGELLGRYRKMHLFDVDLADGTTLRESSSTAPGNEPSLVEIDGFGVGLSICYDVRFPELYRALVDRGAEILVVPAAFTVHTGKAHWHVLLRARAIESQCFVAAAAQWGSHPGGRTTYGHSLLIDPWGSILAESADRSGVIVAELSREELEKVRSSLPSLRHRCL